MNKKVKEIYEKTRDVKNKDKSKQLILRGEKIKNIMIELYLKIIKKIILLILNEFYNTIV